jgi:hypothetical protein
VFTVSPMTVNDMLCTLPTFADHDWTAIEPDPDRERGLLKLTALLVPLIKRLQHLFRASERVLRIVVTRRSRISSGLRRFPRRCHPNQWRRCYVNTTRG